MFNLINIARDYIHARLGVNMPYGLDSGLYLIFLGNFPYKAENGAIG